MEPTNTGSKLPPPPGATANAEAVALQAQVLDYGTLKDTSGENIDTKEDAIEAPKKPPRAGFANYFVRDPVKVNGERCANLNWQRVFKYGTKFDYFLIVVCCVTSIGSGIAIPLMNVVFGPIRPQPDALLRLTVVQASSRVPSPTTLRKAQQLREKSSRQRSIGYLCSSCTYSSANLSCHI